MAGAAERRRKVVLLGPPGAGKGTQAQVLSAHLGVPAISTGDMLREAVAAGSGLGRRVEGVMAAGSLVDDELMAEVVRERLGKPDARSGYLLDGYGAVHPFGIGSNPPPRAVTGNPYWGWDIARSITLNPQGTGGELIDGWGNTHPFTT